MKNILPALITLLLFSCNTPKEENTDYASLVNPLIGTDYKGNVYPGAQAPFGMVQLSPDNGQPGWDWIAGYFYPDSTIAGFSHTHLSGTGAGDLYDISFMPVTYPLKVADAPLGVHSMFSHEREECEAGYYKVHLDVSPYQAYIDIVVESQVFVTSMRSQLLIDFDNARSTQTNKQIEFYDQNQPLYVGADNPFNFRITVTAIQDGNFALVLARNGKGAPTFARYSRRRSGKRTA